MKIGVAVIDKEHRHIFDTINDLYDALHGSGKEGSPAQLLQKVAEETRAHFLSEENLMAGDKYPGLLFHSIKHQYLLKQIDALIGRSKSNGARLTSKAAPLTEFNMSFLRDWFVSHILSEDVNFGLWINEHGKY